MLELARMDPLSLATGPSIARSGEATLSFDGITNREGKV
jgi:hypothetical protein